MPKLRTVTAENGCRAYRFHTDEGEFEVYRDVEWWSVDRLWEGEGRAPVIRQGASRKRAVLDALVWRLAQREHKLPGLVTPQYAPIHFAMKRMFPCAGPDREGFFLDEARGPRHARSLHASYFVQWRPPVAQVAAFRPPGVARGAAMATLLRKKGYAAVVSPVAGDVLILDAAAAAKIVPLRDRAESLVGGFTEFWWKHPGTKLPVPRDVVVSLVLRVLLQEKDGGRAEWGPDETLVLSEPEGDRPHVMRLTPRPDARTAVISSMAGFPNGDGPITLAAARKALMAAGVPMLRSDYMRGTGARLYPVDGDALAAWVVPAINAREMKPSPDAPIEDRRAWQKFMTQCATALRDAGWVQESEAMHEGAVFRRPGVEPAAHRPPQLTLGCDAREDPFAHHVAAALREAGHRARRQAGGVNDGFAVYAPAFVRDSVWVEHCQDGDNRLPRDPSERARFRQAVRAYKRTLSERGFHVEDDRGAVNVIGVSVRRP
ncbi:hypothetical protein G3I60_04930 [Streptomyces sp. SID13666]|uniref:hypothetical protein n=1 Tax=Streptomyces sp. SID13666 TaxID=2706054 RepID=UPI0013C15141|nr:hypothetical protein [Streptomyces sp. SID13666]NEA53513.1 hypothetical protein [Streptomyces sp. SID13666]